MAERFECTTLAKKALYKYSSFPFLFLEWFDTVDWVTEVASGQQTKLYLVYPRLLEELGREG